jgi:hypothetical protein
VIYCVSDFFWGLRHNHNPLHTYLAISAHSPTVPLIRPFIIFFNRVSTIFNHLVHLIVLQPSLSFSTVLYSYLASINSFPTVSTTVNRSRALWRDLSHSRFLLRLSTRSQIYLAFLTLFPTIPLFSNVYFSFSCFQRVLTILGHFHLFLTIFTRLQTSLLVFGHHQSFLTIFIDCKLLPSPTTQSNVSPIPFGIYGTFTIPCTHLDYLYPSPSSLQLPQLFTTSFNLPYSISGLYNRFIKPTLGFRL